MTTLYSLLFVLLEGARKMSGFAHDNQPLLHDALSFGGLALMSASVVWLGFCYKGIAK